MGVLRADFLLSSTAFRWRCKVQKKLGGVFRTGNTVHAMLVIFAQEHSGFVEVLCTLHWCRHLGYLGENGAASSRDVPSSQSAIHYFRN